MKLGLDLSHSFTQRYIAEGKGERLFVWRASALCSACSNEAVDCFTGRHRMAGKNTHEGSVYCVLTVTLLSVWVR